MQISGQENSDDWITRRLHAIPLLGEDLEALRARVLATFSACVGLLTGLSLLIDFPKSSGDIGASVTAMAALAVTGTFLLVRISRTVFWPGIWFGVWSIIAFASQLVMHGEQAAALLPLLVCTPVIFGLIVSARASAISTGVVCTIFAVTASRHAALSLDAASNFPPQLMISAIATALCGALVAYFSFYKEQENRNLTKIQERLEMVASTDPLTSVGNRRSFDQKLRDLKMRADWNAKPALILFDVDKFKLINDTHGHAAGDRVLVEIAHRVADILDTGQSLFRLGGDEFAIVFDDQGQRKALEQTAASAIAAVGKEIPLSGVRLKVDISIGIATSDGGSVSISELYRKSDTASFFAKEQFGSKAVIYDVFLSSKIIRRAAVESQLSVALKNNLIEIAFQPQVDIDTKQVTGFEALARWTDTGLGVISPDEFVRIAEESSLIDRFDRFVVAKSLELASVWLGNKRRISVNVSARSAVSSEFCAFLLEKIAHQQLNPDQVEVEITETALIANWEACRENLEGLRRAGVRIVLDDFGIGYSSLSYLSQFPVQKLKFDRSFLQQAHSAKGIIVMQTIVRLAEALKMEVIAEGVETPLHVTLLRQIQCQTAQGFLYSKPINNDEMQAFIQRIETRADAAHMQKIA